MRNRRTLDTSSGFDGGYYGGRVDGLRSESNNVVVEGVSATDPLFQSGGSPGQLSQATFGHPAGHGYLLAERPPDDENPWEELHVTAGLRSTGSAVTMFPAGSHLQIATGIGAKTFDDNLAVIADSICHLGHFYKAAMLKGAGAYLRLAHAGFPGEESRKQNNEAWPLVLEHLERQLTRPN